MASSEKSPALVPQFWGAGLEVSILGELVVEVGSSIFVSCSFHLKAIECRWRTSQVSVKE